MFGKFIVPFKEKINNSKRKTFQAILGILLLATLAIGVEYFFCGKKLRSIEKKNPKKSFFVLEKNEIKMDGFIQDNQDFFISQKNNARLVIPNDNYIHTLIIELNKQPNLPIKVLYKNQNNQEISLENKLQHALKKNKLSFLNQFTFNLQSNPKEIVIEASDPQTIISQIIVDNQYHFNTPRFLFFWSIGLLIFFLIKIRHRLGKQPELGFLVVALICGSLIGLTSTLSYSSWDERIHYSRTDNKSFKWLLKKKVNDLYAKATSVPFSYSVQEQKTINAFLDNNKKNKFIKNEIKDFSLLTFYNRIAYVPGGFSIFLGRITRVPHHLIFILGRITNLLIFTLITFLAIKKLLTGKMLMAIIALLPTSIFLASHYGYDHWVTAFSFLALAIFFSHLQQPDKKITWKEIFLMIGSLILACGPKTIYFPLFLFFFLLKSTKFQTKKDYQKFLALNTLSLLLVLSSFILPFLILGPGDGDKRGGETVNSTKQVAFILANPIEYSKILFNFLKEYLAPKNSSGFISSFAYLGHVKGFSIIGIILILSLFTTRKIPLKNSLKIKTVLVGFFVFISTTILISTALYVAFTPVKSSIINGVQPRYLIPLLFPFLFSIKLILENVSFKKIPNQNFLNLTTFLILAGILLKGTWDLIIKFYY